MHTHYIIIFLDKGDIHDGVEYSLQSSTNAETVSDVAASGKIAKDVENSGVLQLLCSYCSIIVLINLGTLKIAP